MVVLVVGDRCTVLGTLEAEDGCALAWLDRVLRLHLDALRLGWSIRLTGVDAELRELIELVGVADLLTGDYASMRGGNPNSAKSSG